MHDPKQYVVTLARGSCEKGARSGLRDRFVLVKLDNPTEGSEGGDHVDIPIHHLMKDGYYIFLVDAHSKEVVSCGDP